MAEDSATPASSPTEPAPPPVPDAAPSPGATVTERYWDGWPTPPTPDYLIPRMGNIPVSSTLHFQTVAMTAMGDALSPAEMWPRLREQLLQVAENKADADRRLTVTKAVYGDLQNQKTIDVTDLLQRRVSGERISLIVGTEEFGEDSAPGTHKQLSLEYEIGGAAAAMIVEEGSPVQIGLPRPRIDGTAMYKKYFEPAPTSIAEVADRMTRDGILPTDLDPDAIYSSMEDVVDAALGFAPEERLDPLYHAVPDAMQTPAEGVILYHEQGWYGRGLTLGNLLHSVALAPGEVTQVAMTHWNHTTRSTDSEQVSQSDSTTQADTQDRSVTEIQDSAVREHTAGSSDASSSSASFGLGVSSIEAKASLGWGSVKGSISGTSTSMGTSHTVSGVVTRSDGDKNLAMDSNQKINATTRRHAEAARTRRATVVREVSQSEDETLTTRVLANYNHMHALTVMYFEVIEVFSLRTRVVDAERLVFLPFVVHEVHELIPRYRGVLIDAARAAGRFDLAEAIRHFEYDATRLVALNARITQLQGQVGDDGKATGGEIAAAESRRDTLAADLKDLPTHYTTTRGDLYASVEHLNAQRANVLTGMASLKDLPNHLGGVALTALQAQLQPIESQVARLLAEIEALRRAESRAFEQIQNDRRDNQRRIDVLKAELQRLEDAKRTIEAMQDATTAGPFDDGKLFFNQAVWLSLSPSEVLGLARRRKTFKGEMLCERIDPAPVAVSGNYVAYRWRFDDPVKSQAFKRIYVEPFLNDPEKELASVQADIAVPTGGVFGEAVLGDAVSAEKIDLSRFWNWKDSMIPILPTSINPLTAATPTPQNLSAEPGKLDESSAKLGALQDLPTPSGFNALAQTMQAQIFRDMSGQGMLQSLAEATTKAASSSEQNAAQIASQNLKAGLDFMSDMAAKALSVAAAPETGGGSLLGGMVGSKSGGGASLLGGVLNAEGAGGGKGDLLSKLTGGKGVGDSVGKQILEKAKQELGGTGTAGSGGGTGSGGSGGGSTGGSSGSGGKGSTGAPPNPNTPARELEDVEPPEEDKN